MTQTQYQKYLTVVGQVRPVDFRAFRNQYLNKNMYYEDKDSAQFMVATS
jgi:hypothetical protein